jgi:hypothetical protein
LGLVSTEPATNPKHKVYRETESSVGGRRTAEQNQDDAQSSDITESPAPNEFKELTITALPTVKGTLNSIPVTILVDTGAARTLVSEKWTKQHGQPLVEGTPIRLRFADGGPFTTTSYIAATLVVNEFKDKLLIPICPLATSDVIFGADLISTNNVNIDWISKQIKTGDGRYLSTTPSRRSSLKPVQQISPRTLEKILREGKVANTCSVMISSTTKLEDNIHDSAFADTITSEYSDIFPDELPKELPPKRIVDHEITIIPGAQPTARRYYRMTGTEMEELKRVIKDLLTKGWIRPSSSAYAAPILFVKKSDGTLRFCCDYRALNSITVRNTYPIPDMGELLDRLHDAKYFSKFDLRSGYHQVLVADKDVHKTAFTTRFGNYEWLVLPFGLTNAPATFQRVMNDAFQEFLDVFVIIYLDDILIYSKTWEDHQRHVRLICDKLRGNQLFCKSSKCEFGLTSIEFIGHVVSHNNIHMDPAKIKAVKNWPEPKNVKQLRGFLGFCNFYRKFIYQFAHIAEPLTSCLRRKGLDFKWGEKQQKAFEELCTAMTTEPVLIIPDLKKPYVLHTDASGTCLGAVLSQEGHPVAYLSGKLNGAQMNYDVRELELLALVTALKKWRHYLLDSVVIAYTDHESLKYIKKQADFNRRLVRWLNLFAEYSGLEIVYKPGKDNIAADALSRINTITTFSVDSTETNSWRKDYLDDEEQASTYNALDSTPSIKTLTITFSKEGNLMYAQTKNKSDKRLCVPAAKQALIIREAHDTPMGGHFSWNKTYQRIVNKFYWPKMITRIQNYCTSCLSCQRNKASTVKPLGQMQPLTTPTNRWESISMDFVTALPPSGKEEYDAILTVVDRLTKRVHLIPTHKTATAKDTATLILAHVVKLHGIPRSIVSDRDPRFTSHFWKALCDMLDTKLLMSTANHPETDGQTERANRTMAECLRSYVDSSEDEWHTRLPMVEFAINSAQNASIKTSPFEADLGYIPTTPLSLINGNTNSGVPSADQFITNQSTIIQQVKDRLVHAQSNQKRHHDKRRRPAPTWYRGDQVMVHRSAIVPRVDKTKYTEQKLAARWYGPFIVLGRVQTNAYRIELPANSKAHPVINVRFLKPYKGREDNNPLPDILPTGEAEYEVEKIISQRQRAGKTEFLVRWKGYSPDDDSWEKSEHLNNAEEVVNDYLRSKTN